MAAGGSGKNRPGAPKAPNLVLRRIREQERRETREEFAEAMARLAREMGAPVYPDAKYVARLETGDIRCPRPLYQSILSQLCGRPFSALGFRPTPSLPLPDGRDSRASDSGNSDGVASAKRMNVSLRDAVVTSGLEVQQIARRVGVDPKSVQRWITRGVIPHARHRWKTCEILGRDESQLWPDAVPRAEVTGYQVSIGEPVLWHPATGLNLAPDADLYQRITSAVEDRTHVDSVVISWLEKCLAEHRRVEDEIGAEPLVGVIKSQLSAVAKFARQAPAPLIDQIVDLAAQYAQFMAWICNDLGDKAAALAWYDRAHDWAIEAGDANMAATTLSMKAHLAWSVGDSARCVRLGEAARWTDARTSLGVQGMAAQMIARGHALSSDSDRAHRAIDDAETLVIAAAEHPGDEPPWMYFYGETWLSAQRGMIETELAERGKGEPKYAVALLKRALNALPESYRRDRAWYGAMLARAHSAADNCDAAAKTGVEFAADAIAVNRYAADELEQLSAALNQRGVRQARDLSEALADMKASVRGV